MDPDDNLNLVQPVNPWGGDSWSMYTEYFQWRPVHNSNSRAHRVAAGSTLHGAIVYQPASDSYLLTQTAVETGAVSSQVVACQRGKRYTVPYVVYEKLFPCRDYPPDGVVTFRNITAECDGVPCTHKLAWAAKVKDANCGMAAHVGANGSEISITWDTSLPSRYDNMSYDALHALNIGGRGRAGGGGWAAAAAAAAKKVAVEAP